MGAAARSERTCTAVKGVAVAGDTTARSPATTQVATEQYLIAGKDRVIGLRCRKARKPR